MQDKKYTIQTGDILKIKTLSPLYREEYTAEILSIQEYTLLISMPSYQGKMALLGAGVPVEISCMRNDLNFSSEVVSRVFKPTPHLVLQLPYELCRQKKQRPRVVTVTSGKGGVGKTTFTINFAISLAQLGQRVFIIDADLGTANIDVLLNLHPKYNLSHIVKKEKELLDIIVEGPAGIHLIPGGSGMQNLADMEKWQFNHLISSLQTLEQYADIILIDTGAGLSKNVINFVLAADNPIIITTPEPHAITDAYAIMKVLDENQLNGTPHLIINRVDSYKEYQEISSKILQVVNRFLNLHIKPLGYILEDSAIARSNRHLQVYMLEYPENAAASCLKNIAIQFLNPDKQNPVTIERSFFSKLKELFGR